MGTDGHGYSVDPQRAWRMEQRVVTALRFALCSMLLHVFICKYILIIYRPLF